MKLGRPELTERNEAIVRGFLGSQLRVSVLAKQFSMSEAAVTRVLHRRIKPAVRGLSLTVNPTLHQLQLRVASGLGARRAKNLLERHYLLSGQSAEAFLLQEAGVRSRLFELLAAGEDNELIGLRDKVLVAPRAAQLALNRLMQRDELYSQARRLKTAMEGLSLRGPDLPGSAKPNEGGSLRRPAIEKPTPRVRKPTITRSALRKSPPKRRRRSSNKPLEATGWSVFGDNSKEQSSGGCLTSLAVVLVVIVGLWGLTWMVTQTAFPVLQLLAGGIFLAIALGWAIASA